MLFKQPCLEYKKARFLTSRNLKNKLTVKPKEKGSLIFFFIYFIFFFQVHSIPNKVNV